MRKIDVTAAKEIADRKGLQPSRVAGTTGVQLTSGHNGHLESVSWEEFERTLATRQLAIYEHSGWLKIMRSP